jgi:hypothetical protein
MPKILNKYSQERNIGASVPCNFHIHVSVRELYIPTMGLPFLLEEICGPILGIYKSLTDHAISRKGIYKLNCRCSAVNINLLIVCTMSARQLKYHDKAME